MNMIPGLMEETELHAIAQFSSRAPKDGIIVEVGSFLGRSTVAWAGSCDPSVLVFCVDPWPDSIWSDGPCYVSPETFEVIKPPMTCVYGEPSFNIYKEFLKNVREFKNVRALRGSCPDKTNWDGRAIDILFLDGDHRFEGVISAFQYFQPHLKPGAIIAGHDYNSENPGTIAAVNEIRDSLATTHRFYQVDYTSLWALEPLSSK